MKMAEQLDETDWAVLQELHRDARISLTELARRVSLSRPAVAERVRKLEESGVIAGYSVQVDPSRLGFHVTAIVRVRTHDPSGRLLKSMLDEIPEIVECRHVSGEDCFYTLVWTRSVADLERITTRLAHAGHTTTSVIFGTLAEHRLPGDAGAQDYQRRLS